MQMLPQRKAKVSHEIFIVPFLSVSCLLVRGRVGGGDEPAAEREAGFKKLAPSFSITMKGEED